MMVVVKINNLILKLWYPRAPGDRCTQRMSPDVPNMAAALSLGSRAGFPSTQRNQLITSADFRGSPPTFLLTAS